MFELGPQVPARCTAPGARTVGDMFWRRAARSASRPALFEKTAGRWAPTSWADLYARAARVARGLRALGVAPQDRVGVLGPTQPRWATYDLGAQLAGAVSFGVYPKQSAEQIRYLLTHSEAKVIFVAEPAELEATLEAAKEAPDLRAIVPWTDALFSAFADRDPRVTSPRRFEAAPLDEAEVRATVDRTDPDDTAIFIYTSGTTGPPKGAMISHRNILSLLSAAAGHLPYLQSDISLHFLPMAHAAERVLGFYGRLSQGIPGAYAESTATVLDDLRAVRPTLFGSVPRIFEKAYARIHGELEKKPPAARRVFDWADRVGRRAAPYFLAQRPLPPRLAVEHALADRLVFRKVRAAFGGRVRQMLTGAAPTAVEILEFFWGAKIPVYEVYGMTESTVISHANRPGAVRLGTVGRVIAPGDHRIADDGEVLIRAPWVFRGYAKNEAATAETVVDGWLHTGDVGVIDADGYLRITDRKKHLIITAGGKNLAPANIENAIKHEDPLISQVHAHGDRRPFVSALVTPAPLETLAWGAERGLVSEAEIAEHTRALMENPAGRSEALNAAMARVVALPAYRARIAAAVDRGNRRLARVERVRKLVLLERDFSQEEGELTPTLKVRRKAIEQKHAALFDRIYDEPDFGLEPG